MLPPSELPHARRAGPSRGREPRGCLREARPAWSSQRQGAAGGLWGPPTLSPGARLGAQRIEGLPRRRSSAARDSLPLSLSQPVLQARSTPPQPCSSFSAESTAATGAALQPLGAAVPGREWRAEQGRERGKPRPSTRAAALSTHPLGSAPIASPTANGSTPRRQMTRKYVTGARRAALGAGSGAGSTAPSAATRHSGGPTRKGGRAS